MKKQGILNSDISRVLSYMGDTDCIAGVPSFMDVLRVIIKDMKVEKIVLAEEIREQNPKVLGEIKELFAGQELETAFVSHTELKKQTRECKAVIRTGETTPYANIILQSGCIFG